VKLHPDGIVAFGKVMQCWWMRVVFGYLKVSDLKVSDAPWFSGRF
jgi:hypothetical protein